MAGSEDSGKTDLGRLSDDDTQHIAWNALSHARKVPRFPNTVTGAKNGKAA